MNNSDRKTPIPLSVSDIGYVFEEIWQGKSPLSNSTDQLTLVRWDNRKPLSTSNVICLTRKEAEHHRKLRKSEWQDVYSDEFLQFVADRLKLEAKWSASRSALFL